MNLPGTLAIILLAVVFLAAVLRGGHNFALQDTCYLLGFAAFVCAAISTVLAIRRKRWAGTALAVGVLALSGGCLGFLKAGDCRRDLFRVSTERLGGDSEGILDVGPEQPKLPGVANIRGKVVAVDQILGRVLAVDQRTGRVAVNLGTRQGIKKGDAFIVFRSAAYIGKLSVEEVTSESTSTASYLREFMKGEVEIGDGVAARVAPATPPQPKGPPPEKREGKAEPPGPAVKAIDKDRGHVTLNVGQRQGIKKGDRFVVFRDAQFVGIVVVDEVRPEESSAEYDRSKMKLEPQVGDDIALRRKVDF